MIYKISHDLNDGLCNAPPFEIEIKTLHELADWVHGELANDYGVPFGVGVTLTIERIA